MLQHQPEEPTVSNAADARVTPEELNAALKTLDDTQSSTVAIGSVVDELRLNATPEQIWEQVQKQRAEKQRAVQTVIPTATTRPRRRVRWWAVAIVGVVVWGAVHSRPPQTPSVTVMPPILTTPGQSITISGDGQIGTIAVRGKDVVISGDGDNLTLQGQARSVTVSGDGDTVRGDAPKVFDTTGDNNDIKWTGEPHPVAPRPPSP